MREAIEGAIGALIDQAIERRTLAPEVADDLTALRRSDVRASAIVGRYGSALGAFASAVIDGRIDPRAPNAPAVLLAVLDAQRRRWLATGERRQRAERLRVDDVLPAFTNPTISVGRSWSRKRQLGIAPITGRHDDDERGVWAGIPGLSFTGSPGPAPDNYRDLDRHARLLRALSRHWRQERHRSTRAPKRRRVFLGGSYAPGGAYCSK